MGRGCWFNYGKLPPNLVTWRFVREMVGSAVVVSVCIYPREGEREEFKTCLLHVTESTTSYSIYIYIFFRVITFHHPQIYLLLHFTHPKLLEYILAFCYYLKQKIKIYS